ncbi:MAG: DUF2268 domain-containing putative Zn-dependent protease, partial [Rhodothermales bacterium]|nr:DUF2268 domain-containing putative Zn-dependent protease [Rhodothermales bacterium]
MISRLVVVALSAVIFSSSSLAQLTDDRTPDPLKARFVVDDVRNFITAFEMLTAGADTLAILNAEYFEKGTPGLDIFVEKYDLTPERLRNAIRKHPEEYEALRVMPKFLAESEPHFRDCYVELKRVVPHAEFPPTYFLVGSYRGIGSGSQEGPLITVEKEDKTYIGDRMNAFLTHEMVHLQQVEAIGLEKYLAIFGPEKSLLALTIREGIAEFFADLAVGEITQEEARRFVIENEGVLWERFQQDMMGQETGDWMWSTPSDPDQPPHVAYYFGARIVEAYYHRAADKEKAVREILAVTDYPAFLEAS